MLCIPPLSLLTLHGAMSVGNDWSDQFLFIIYLALLVRAVLYQHPEKGVPNVLPHQIRASATVR